MEIAHAYTHPKFSLLYVTVCRWNSVPLSLLLPIVFLFIINIYSKHASGITGEVLTHVSAMELTGLLSLW